MVTLMAFTHVDKPFQIKGVTLKNRVCRSAHATGYSDLGVTDDLISYHEARARGGVAMSILEIFSVHWSSPRGLNCWGPDLGDRYRLMVDRCARHGMHLFQQLWHGGHNAFPRDGTPPWSASHAPGPLSGVVPLKMSRSMIAEVVEGFARSAMLCEKWGAAGVEVHGAHGYLLAQFLSPNYNDRDDDYGGSFENRARLTFEVLEAIRSAVSSDYPVGIRLAPDLNVNGVDVEDCRRLALELEARGLIDFVDLSYGAYENLDKVFSGMHDGAGYELPSSRVVTHAVKVPRIVTGRIRTLEEADQILRDGDADLVSMTRAHIADPDIVRKTLAGRAEDVRPCIGCNQGCVAGVMSPARWMGCTVNPSVGFEKSMDEHALVRMPDPRRIVVVGGGPAGLEAARVAAVRGHQVVLMEASSRLGGTLKLAREAPYRQGIDDIAVWLEEQVYKLGVDVRLSTYCEADDVLAERPDCVIVATGAFPRMDGVQLSHPGEPIGNMEARHVMSSRDLFLAPSSHDFGSHAVVIDEVGHYEAIASAEYLLARGVAVSFVTRLASFAPLLESSYTVLPALRRMGRLPFTLHSRTRVLRVEQDHVIVLPSYVEADSNAGEPIRADTVVFVSPDLPNCDLVEPLRAAGIEVVAVGDANSARFLPAAIREGHLAGAAA